MRFKTRKRKKNYSNTAFLIDSFLFPVHIRMYLFIFCSSLGRCNKTMTRQQWAYINVKILFFWLKVLMAIWGFRETVRIDFSQQSMPLLLTLHGQRCDNATTEHCLSECWYYTRCVLLTGDIWIQLKTAVVKYHDLSILKYPLHSITEDLQRKKKATGRNYPLEHR